MRKMLLGAPFVLVLLGACASSSPSATPQGTPDSDAGTTSQEGGDDTVDSAAPTPFPAYPLTLPKLNHYGKVIAKPRIVAITFSDDPLEATLDDFNAKASGSTWWSGLTEYGVSAFTAVPVHLTTAAPAAVSEADIGAWLKTLFDGTHPEVPAHDANTLYAIFYPKSTTITLDQGDACAQGVLGFPGAVSVMYNSYVVTVPYAVSARCDDTADLFTLHTGALYVDGVVGPGWRDPNNSNASASALCPIITPWSTKVSDLPYSVPRYWSNAAAAAFQDPCVPAPAGPFAAAQALPAETNLPFKVGKPRVVDVNVSSSAPTQPLTIEAKVRFAKDASTVTLALDRNQAVNGDKLKLTITALKASTNQVVVDLFTTNPDTQDRTNLAFSMLIQ